MSPILLAGACLVVAQAVGIYALKTRKADLVFSVVMVGLLAAAAGLGYLAASKP